MHGTLRARHVENATLRPVSDTAHCRMRRILQCGNGRTGANLPRERVDRGDGIFCIEVDATVDCVPVASSRVARVAFEAQTAHVGLVRDDGRALARLLVVEAKRGRRADPSGRAQRKCCQRDHTEAELGLARPAHAGVPAGVLGVVSYRRFANVRECMRIDLHEQIGTSALDRKNLLRTRERCRKASSAATTVERPYRSS